MLVYSTKLYVKKSVKSYDIEELFVTWLRGSRHYGCKNLTLKTLEANGNVYQNDKITFTVKGYAEPALRITACCLENIDGGKWTVSCIFYENKNGSNYILVQQEFQPEEGGRMPPEAHRPFLVKLLANKGWMDESRYLFAEQTSPAGETVHYKTADAEDFPRLAAYINGESEEELPLVYISYPFKGRRALPLAFIEKLAIDLIGTAYVVVEPNDTAFADKLSLCTHRRKVFRGFVGVYFPNCKEDYIFYNPERRGRCLHDLLLRAVWLRAPEADINWKRLLDVCAGDELLSEQADVLEKLKRERIEHEQALAFYNGLNERLNNRRTYFAFPELTEDRANAAFKERLRNLIIGAIGTGCHRRYSEGSRGESIANAILEANPKTEYIREVSSSLNFPAVGLHSTDADFDAAARRLEEEIEENRRKNISYISQLAYYEDTVPAENPCKNMLFAPAEREQLEGDFGDAVIMCLRAALDTGIYDSEEEELIRSVLAVNPQHPTAEKRMEELRRVISKADRVSDVRALLEKMGLQFTDLGGGHLQATFAGKKYTVTFAATPSDNHSNKNSAADLLKQISLY